MLKYFWKEELTIPEDKLKMVFYFICFCLLNLWIVYITITIHLDLSNNKHKYNENKKKKILSMFFCLEGFQCALLPTCSFQSTFYRSTKLNHTPAVVEAISLSQLLPIDLQVLILSKWRWTSDNRLYWSVASIPPQTETLSFQNKRFKISNIPVTFAYNMMQ